MADNAFATVLETLSNAATAASRFLSGDNQRVASLIGQGLKFAELATRSGEEPEAAFDRVTAIYAEREAEIAKRFPHET